MQSIKTLRHTTHVDINTVKPQSHIRHMRQYPDCVTVSDRQIKKQRNAGRVKHTQRQRESIGRRRNTETKKERKGKKEILDWGLEFLCCVITDRKSRERINNRCKRRRNCKKEEAYRTEAVSLCCCSGSLAYLCIFFILPFPFLNGIEKNVQ